MTIHRYGMHLAGVATVLAAAAFTVVAEQPPREPSAFAEIVDVELINVEVWVTDRKGRSITGLGVEDFEVSEDGDPVAISHFAEVAGPVATAGEVTTLEPALEEPRAVAEAVEDPGHLVVFIDEGQLGVVSRKRVVKALKGFLDSREVAAERILILRQLDTVTTAVPFGSSADEVRAAVDELAVPSAAATGRSTEKDLLKSRLKMDWQSAQTGFGDPCLRFAHSAVSQVQAFTEESRARISSTFANLGQVVTRLAGTPGMKTLVYVSDSLELRPGADLRAFVDTNCPPGRYGESNYVPPPGLGGAISRLALHANSNRVTFYTLQSSGLKSDSGFGAENSSTSSLAALRAMDRESRFVERDGLVTLANLTGGRASFNSNGLDRILQEIAGYMSSYYSLAYAPAHSGDGGEHRIKVRVKVPKAEVRYRERYIDKSPDERMTERLESALYLGALSNPLAARLAVGEVQAGAGDRFQVRLHLLVPSEKVIFLPDAGRDVMQLRAQIAIHNNKNAKLDLQGKVFRAERLPDSQETLDFVFELDLAEGSYEVAVGLRDVASGETSYIRTSVAVGEPSNS